MKKYRITNIRLAGNRWIADVQEWEKCICESEPVTVEIHQEKRPSRSVIIEVFNGI